jgi:GntR family transcriptional regulator / MocR family aminotransferase
MAVEWAGLGPELLLTLDRRQGQLGAQVQAGVREAIRSGRLRPGERLPSSRELARKLGVSRGLVQDCYAQLLAEGYLSAAIGSATRVAAVVHAEPVPGPAAVRHEGDAPAASTAALADFRSGVPDLSGFPRTDWLWALREASRTAPNAAFDYGDQRGSAGLREVLAAYLRRVRAAVADPENLVICTGFAQGLGMTLRLLVRDGLDQVAFEDPGYGDTPELAAWAGITAVPVPVDEEGIDVAALSRTGARVVVLTPAHQWPTGGVLSPGRRHELAVWATGCDGVIIEDDYDAEFRYDREPVGVLQGLAPDRVISIGTVSKSLAPAMRIGWLLCPPALAPALAAEKELGDRGSPTLDQLALATLIESGRYDRHLRRMRGVYSQRRDVLTGALAEHAPAVRLTGLAAGFHAVAHLPAPLREQEVIAAARARSVRLYGMSDYRAGRGTEPAQLVLGFGNLGERAIAAGIAAISDLLRG